MNWEFHPRHIGVRDLFILEANSQSLGLIISYEDFICLAITFNYMNYGEFDL